MNPGYITLEMYLPLQNNSLASEIIGARDIFVRLILSEAAPSGISLKRIFIREDILLVIPEKIARQIEEILKPFIF